MFDRLHNFQIEYTLDLEDIPVKEPIIWYFLTFKCILILEYMNDYTIYM